VKALLCHAHGPPESLVLGELEPPEAGPGEVLVRVRACGINYPDLLVIEDKYQFHPELPFAPGGEVSGEIAALGEGVERFREGDRVIAMTTAHGLQQYTVAPETQCFALPQTMDYETGAAFSMTYGTAWHALRDRAGIAEGESLLVLGASGGVGSAAIDIARNLGVHIIAAGGSDEKLAALQALYPVDEVINYNSVAGSFRDAVNALTQGRGADVILDPVGGELFQQCLRCIAWNGRILVVGFAADSEELPMARTNLLVLKGSALLGVFLGRFAKEEPARNAANFEELFRWHAEGRLTPHISHRFPLERGVEALQALAKRAVVGKCVVTLD